MASVVEPALAPVLDASTTEWEALRERVLAQGIVRMHADVQKLRDLGIVDEQGRTANVETPADMKPGAKRDFGG